MPTARRRPKKKNFEEAYFDYFNKYRHPPSLEQILKLTGLSKPTAVQKFRKLVKEGKIPAVIGNVKTRKTVDLSANEYAALMFAQEYKKGTGQKVDPAVLSEMLGSKTDFYKVTKSLKNKLGPKEYHELFTSRSLVRRGKGELREHMHKVLNERLKKSE